MAWRPSVAPPAPRAAAPPGCGSVGCGTVVAMTTAGPAADPGYARVVHAMARGEWDGVRREVRPASLAAEGFIHLSTPEQIAWVCTERFAGREDLVLLVVDPRRLPVPLVWEDCYDTGQAFPHLYAPLPVTAVTAVLDYRPGADGRFGSPTLP